MTETTGALFAAVAKVQARIVAIEPDAQNPQLRNRYTSLDGIRKKMQPALTEAGLTLMQPLTTSGERAEVTTIVAHPESGEWLMSTASIKIPPTNKGTNVTQVEGSAISYLRRYAIMSLFGFVSGEDDDASAAGPAPEPTKDSGTGLSDKQARMVHAMRDKLGLSNDEIVTAITASSDGKIDNPLDLETDDQLKAAWGEAQSMAEAKKEDQ